MPPPPPKKKKRKPVLACRTFVPEPTAMEINLH